MADPFVRVLFCFEGNTTVINFKLNSNASRNCKALGKPADQPYLSLLVLAFPRAGPRAITVMTFPRQTVSFRVDRRKKKKKKKKRKGRKEKEKR